MLSNPPYHSKNYEFKDYTQYQSTLEDTAISGQDPLLIDKCRFGVNKMMLERTLDYQMAMTTHSLYSNFDIKLIIHLKVESPLL